MRRIDGGTFSMGSEAFYADEGPVHTVTVAAFDLDEHPVTNAQFAQFVADTGYLTVAERPIELSEMPGLNPADAQPGALVFTPTAGPVDLSNWRQWWTWVPGASWCHPRGIESTIEGLDEHPVVQVSYEDVTSFAAWTGKRLPTEAEWEFAARGGLEGATFAWGEELRPGDVLMANTWQGRFPYDNTGANGWVGTSPVGSFAPNGYGLFDMIGNVWEWTSDAYTPRHQVGGMDPATCSCGPDSAPSSQQRQVLKGGSHLCAPEYCLRYRPAARSPQSSDTATTHIGFRCARSV